ncbi:hypothetical protein [Pseudomonas citronellolis]|uniref:hypothetical protein n=1 Tax=Pseudomonas citronellolis TaxID=53408 RepID=UPI0021C23277|nr:hypothetical protein [Pseudomonas citronellolis]UXJ55055.1 hypothetical protein N5P21_12900 [Pseudomonas citronellolis]
MRQMGIVLLVIGVVVIICALNMDVSVSTEVIGQRVNNIGLMADRQNYMMVGSLIVIVGLLMAIFGERATARTASEDDSQNSSCMRFLKLVTNIVWGLVIAVCIVLVMMAGRAVKNAMSDSVGLAGDTYSVSQLS